MHNVCVLMSTYNGEKYLREQIESLKLQKGVCLSILARDDGSSDATIGILDEYKNAGVLEWYSGENIGSARSFLDLVAHAPECEYYAFCDQDDYWFPEKLAAAIGKLAETDNSKSALYFSGTQFADANLNPIPLKDKCDFATLRIPAAFMFNIAKGCTMVFNRCLAERLSEYHPETVDMHDAWVYKVCLVTGNQVIADPNSYILYRQHGSNVIGESNGFIGKWRKKLSALKSNPHFRSRVVQEILRGYDGNLTDREREQLQVLGNYRSRFGYWVKVVFSPSYSAPFLKYTLLFKLAVLFRMF